MQLAPTSTDPAGGGDAGVRISIIVSEAEAVGGFAGGSFSEPVLNAGILLSVFGYMLYVEPWMALVALLMFSPQLLFIPTLQEAINRRTQRRIETLRAVSVAIREAADIKNPKHVIGGGSHVYLLNAYLIIRKFGSTS